MNITRYLMKKLITIASKRLISLLIIWYYRVEYSYNEANTNK